MAYPLTAVSGYWIVKNKFDKEYLQWFNSTLKINCPYIFFGNAESIEIAKYYRGSLPTYYIECELSEFYTYKYREQMAVHPVHCPSVELNLIWNEKIFLIEKAARLNLYGSKYYAWIDAGICTYRNKLPPQEIFPDYGKLSQLPLDKFIFTSSDIPIFEPHKLGSYYHYIAGTSYIIGIEGIPLIVEQYKKYLGIIRPDNIYTDQVILTYILKGNPELFLRIGHGYGEVVPLLY
jgi:hypothetical protein